LNTIALRTATAAQLERILDDTHPQWGLGLTRRAFGQWNAGQILTPWWSSNVRRVALTEGGELQASAKWYDLTMRLEGRSLRVLGIGAVFVAPEVRRRGFGSRIVEEMTAAAANDGYDAALLFSEIGAAFYERLGFTVVPIDAPRISATRGRGAPGTLVRTGDDRDIASIAEMQARTAANAKFSLERSADLIRFFLTKKRLQAGLGPIGFREVEFFVAEEGHMAVAFVLRTRGPNGLVLDECGDRDPSGARVGAILRALDFRQPDHEPEIMTAWLPAGWRPPQIQVHDVSPASEIMMIRPLGAMPKFDLNPGETLYWHGDAF
jgi:predicted N-acetyltransferase YhbS